MLINTFQCSLPADEHWQEGFGRDPVCQNHEDDVLRSLRGRGEPCRHQASHSPHAFIRGQINSGLLGGGGPFRVTGQEDRNGVSRQSYL